MNTIKENIMQQYGKKIIEALDKEIITANKEFYFSKKGKEKNVKDKPHPLDRIFRCMQNLNENEKDILYSEIINYYLDILSDYRIGDMDKFLSVMEDISFKFAYVHYAYGDAIKNECFNLQDNAALASNDLTAKCCNANGRSIDLPISLDTLESYGLNYNIEPKDLELALRWIVLRLSVAHFILTEK